MTDDRTPEDEVPESVHPDGTDPDGTAVDRPDPDGDEPGVAGHDGTGAADAEPDGPAADRPERDSTVRNRTVEPEAATDASPADAAAGPVAQTPVARRIGARRAAIAGLRLATGLVGVAVAIVVIAAVGLAPAAPQRTASSIRVVPDPAPLVRACPGALLAFAGDDASAPPSSQGRATVVADALGARLDRSTLTPSASEAQLLTASAGRDALLAGAQSQVADSDDLRGLATAACGDPVSSAWLVGGATTTGRTSFVTLSNPTEVDAGVDLRVWGENGPVDAPGLRGILVRAGAQTVLSLAGFSQNSASPVVQVRSTGGRVLAALQESILRAVDPGGVDLASPSAAGTRLVIPGVELNALAAVNALRGRDDYGDLQPVLRLLDPGEHDTSVRVGIRPEGQGAGTAFTVPLTAGTALDVPIDSIAAGRYTVTLDADEPIVAGARVSSARALVGTDPLESPVSDLAWIAPAPEIDQPTAFAAPRVGGRLHVVAESATTLTLKGTGTPDLSVQVPAGGAASVDLAPGGVYRVDPRTPVRMQIASGADGQISAYPIAPPPAVSGPIVVRR